MYQISAIILGIIQGATEFLPVSSSGHLIIVPFVMSWNESPLVFDTTLHLGTLCALIVYFYKDLAILSKSFITDLRRHRFAVSRYSEDSRLVSQILLASIPAGIVGLILGDFIEQSFRDPLWVALFLFLGTVLMYLADRFYARIKKNHNLTYVKAFMIGVSQLFALFPGFSRSGTTISMGMLLGLDRPNSARFSFLMSVPIVLVAGVYKLITSFNDSAVFSDPSYLIFGFLFSFISGIFAIGFLLKFVKENDLSAFILYRLFLVFILLAIFLK